MKLIFSFASFDQFQTDSNLLFLSLSFSLYFSLAFLSNVRCPKYKKQQSSIYWRKRERERETAFGSVVSVFVVFESIAFADRAHRHNLRRRERDRDSNRCAGTLNAVEIGKYFHRIFSSYRLISSSIQSHISVRMSSTGAIKRGGFREKPENQ